MSDEFDAINGPLMVADGAWPRTRPATGNAQTSSAVSTRPEPSRLRRWAQSPFSLAALAIVAGFVGMMLFSVGRAVVSDLLWIHQIRLNTEATAAREAGQPKPLNK